MLVMVSSFISDEGCGLVDISLRDWRKTLNMGFLFTDPHYTGHFIMSFVITNIYNKKTKGPTLTELFMATGKLKKFF